MKLSVLAIGVLALAGCSNSTTTSSTTTTTVPLSKGLLSALPATATMPTGTANFVGKFEGISTASTTTFREDADFNLAANFDAKAVQGTISNYQITETSAGNTSIVKTTGNSTGPGTITGSSFTLPKLTGTFTVTEFTKNGVAQTITTPTLSGNSNVAFSGNFVGENAQGIYGTGPVTGGSYTIFGTKQ